MTNPTLETQSLCPACLRRIPAFREIRRREVFLVKHCPDHGTFRTLVWRGPPSFESWRRPKIPVPPPETARPVDRGCPFDCGLCPDHRQRSCTVILEVTGRCDLGCPVCYAGSGRHSGSDPDSETVAEWYRSVARAAGACNIQLSGGEPTMRDDLPALVKAGQGLGFAMIQVNTNGLRLARDPAYVEALREAGLTSIFLQFDGTDDATYRTIRGRGLLEEKLAAIEACARNGIGVVLVPTVIPGVNDKDVGAILKLALSLLPTVRAVHFQPVSYFGRYPGDPQDRDRLTLPELMQAVESQTGGLFKASHFRPPGCENALCSFHGNVLVLADGSVRSLQSPFDGTCCGGPERADVGARRSISYVARQWKAPREAETPGGDRGCECRTASGLIRLDDFLDRARTHTLSVSAMAFQDAWTLDLERVRDCCIHVLSPGGGLIPFCLYNLSSVKGRTLYRP